MRAVSVCYFGYTSFEQATTVSEEAISPIRDVPKAVIGGVAFQTVQFTFLAYYVSGWVPQGEAAHENMMQEALFGKGYMVMGFIVTVGAVIALFPSIMDSLIVTLII